MVPAEEWIRRCSYAPHSLPTRGMANYSGLLSVHAMRLAKASNLGDKLSKHTL